jgi:hypothetical protein
LVRGHLAIGSGRDDKPGTLPATFEDPVNREMKKIVFVGALGGRRTGSLVSDEEGPKCFFANP